MILQNEQQLLDKFTCAIISIASSDDEGNSENQLELNYTAKEEDDEGNSENQLEVNYTAKEENISDDLHFNNIENSANNLETNQEDQSDDASVLSLKPVQNIDTSVGTSNSTSSDKEWKCLTCEKLLPSRPKLIEHYKVVHDAYEDAEIFNNFTKTVTSDGDQYKCAICKETLNSRKGIKNHMVSHGKDRPYNCSICGHKFKTVTDIIRHARAHAGYKVLTCSQGCGFRTVYRTLLQTHEKRHQTDYKFKCDLCDKAYRTQAQHLAHQKTHSETKPYVCDDCGKGFILPTYLARHRVKMLASDERHYCTHCSFECGSRCLLSQHLKEHKATSHLCDICGKKLSTPEYLVIHKRTHLENKPHSCGTCGKCFVKKCSLTHHERAHSGERPYVCAECGKGFIQRASLIVHIRYHEGARPYECTKCQKAYVSRGQLSKHKTTCRYI